jgi:hypothetical protein
MFSLPAQFFNMSFPLHLGITEEEEEEEVQTTSRKISVNRQSEAEKIKRVRVSETVRWFGLRVRNEKWPREGMSIHLQLIIS